MNRSELRKIRLEDTERQRPCHLSAPRWRRDQEERAIARCDGVIDLVAALFNVPGRELRGHLRGGRETAQARQLAMYVAHVALGMNMREVGLGFGRDRTCVVHACHLIEDMRDDVEFDRLVSMTERVVAAAFGVGATQ